MEQIYAILRKYPNRIKYGILILDIFAMMFAIKTYVNYISIETAIENATIDQQNQTDELAFTQNFLINYEKSEYAKYFLEHENNMLLSDEYIIKLDDVREQKVPTLAEVKPQLIQMLTQDQNFQKAKFMEMMESFKSKAKIQ